MNSDDGVVSLTGLGERALNESPQVMATWCAGLPPYIIIEGISYRIRLDPLLGAAEGLSAKISPARGEIVICDARPAVDQWASLLHEILHFITDGLDKGDPENLVTALSSRLFGVIRQNRICFTTCTADPPDEPTNDPCGCSKE